MTGTTWWFIPRIVSGWTNPAYKWDKWGQCPLITRVRTNPPKRFVGCSPPSMELADKCGIEAPSSAQNSSENMSERHLGWWDKPNMNGNMPNWWQPNHQPVIKKTQFNPFYGALKKPVPITSWIILSPPLWTEKAWPHAGPRDLDHLHESRWVKQCHNTLIHAEIKMWV